MYDLTDREIEYGLKDNAAYQVFSGKGILAKWHAPDHTKIESFRNRLTPETQRVLANELSKIAVNLGFANPDQVDFDSTVQEANISYPSDASLMTKLAGLGKKVLDYLKFNSKGLVPLNLEIDMKAIKTQAQKYFFLAKNVKKERRREVFAKLHLLVKKELYPVIEFISSLNTKNILRSPWNIQLAINQIRSDARRYLLDVAHFVRTNTMKTGKLLSFRCKEIACIKKGKAGKELEFGRVFQLGRIQGNFLFVAASESIRMNDKKSLIPLLIEHAQLFGDSTLDSFATDKGYWSLKNYEAAKKRSIREIGLQKPRNVQNLEKMGSPDIQQNLRDRRAGIEPLIGHCKHGGQLGQSRMKSDRATLCAGYASVLGLNLRQLIRYQGEKLKKTA